MRILLHVCACNGLLLLVVGYVFNLVHLVIDYKVANCVFSFIYLLCQKGRKTGQQCVYLSRGSSL